LEYDRDYSDLFYGLVVKLLAQYYNDMTLCAKYMNIMSQLTKESSDRAGTAVIDEVELINVSDLLGIRTVFKFIYQVP